MSDNTLDANESTSQLACRAQGDQVLVMLPPHKNWALMDAETARLFGESVAKCAYEAHYGKPPPDGTKIFTDQKREVLVRRIEIMLIGFIPKVPAMTPHQMAVAITDTLLAEVL
jgi:hypothetical protein